MSRCGRRAASKTVQTGTDRSRSPSSGFPATIADFPAASCAILCRSRESPPKVTARAGAAEWPGIPLDNRQPPLLFENGVSEEIRIPLPEHRGASMAQISSMIDLAGGRPKTSDANWRGRRAPTVPVYHARSPSLRAQRSNPISSRDGPPTSSQYRCVASASRTRGGGGRDVIQSAGGRQRNRGLPRRARNGGERRRSPGRQTACGQAAVTSPGSVN